jgi:hypothetical protein
VFAIAGKEGTANEFNVAQANKQRIFGLHNPGNGWTRDVGHQGFFTSHANLAGAPTACGNYMRGAYPEIVWL